SFRDAPPPPGRYTFTSDRSCRVDRSEKTLSARVRAIRLCSDRSQAADPAQRPPRVFRLHERHLRPNLMDGSAVRTVISGARDLAAPRARGAHVRPPAIPAVLAGAHGLDVRVPAAVGAAVRVRDGHAEARTLSTDVADGSHLGHSSGRR